MVNLCIVNEDHPRCNVPRKAIKACPGRDQLSLSWALSSPFALSHLESGHAVPFSPQDFCSPCVFVYCCHNTGSHWPGSESGHGFRDFRHLGVGAGKRGSEGIGKDHVNG